MLFSTQVTIGASPAAFESVALSGMTAWGIRISLSDDSVNATRSRVGVKFELYGCVATINMTAIGRSC